MKTNIIINNYSGNDNKSKNICLIIIAVAFACILLAFAFRILTISDIAIQHMFEKIPEIVFSSIKHFAN